MLGSLSAIWTPRSPSSTTSRGYSAGSSSGSWRTTDVLIVSRLTSPPTTGRARDHKEVMWRRLSHSGALRGQSREQVLKRDAVGLAQGGLQCLPGRVLTGCHRGEGEGRTNLVERLCPKHSCL